MYIYVYTIYKELCISLYIGTMCRYNWILLLLDKYCTFSVHVRTVSPMRAYASFSKARVSIAPFTYVTSSICAYTLHFLRPGAKCPTVAISFT